MSNYTKSTNFATKDNLSSGDPLKIVKGTEIDTEFNNIATAIATKADLASPTFTGTTTIPTVAISAGTITGITDLAVADGGTGASTATDARTNLSAAKSGANSDITSLSGLTTALSVAQGGTGSTSLTANNVLLGNGTSALQAVAPGSSGNVLTSDGTTWTSATPSTTVTSATAGNGIAVSASTGAVTFSVAAPTAGSVGSYVSAYSTPTGSGNTAVTYNSNYTAGSSQYQIQTASTVYLVCPAGLTTIPTNNLSGTWKWLGATVSQNGTYGAHGLAVRVA